VSRQAALALRLHDIDRWLQVTMVVMVICLIIIATVYFYQHWARPSAMLRDPWSLNQRGRTFEAQS